MTENGNQRSEIRSRKSAQPLAAMATSLIENRDFGIPSQIQEVGDSIASCHWRSQFNQERNFWIGI